VSQYPDAGLAASSLSDVVVGPPQDFARPPVRSLGPESAGRELVRALIAIVALALVFLTVYLAYHASQHGRWGAAKQWLQVVLPAETGTLGSALGFYFGSSRGGAGRPD
jgi:hypothetical protein